MVDFTGAPGRAKRLLALAAGVAASAGLTWAKPDAPPADIRGAIQGFQAVLPDAQHKGKPLWEISAKSVDATFSQNSVAVLHGVTAYLYQNGVRSAVLTAPRAVGDKASRTITATGRVHVRSLTKQKAYHGAFGFTTLDADTVQWQADKNHIVATGHVRCKSGANGMVLTGPAYVADTKLQTFRSTGPGSLILPRGLR